MNQEQLAAVLRQVLLVACGGFVAKGWVDNDTLQIMITAVITLGIAGYGIWKRRTNGLILSAANQPSVSKIVTDPVTADSVPSHKVVDPSKA